MQRRGKQAEKYKAHIGINNFYKYYSNMYFREVTKRNKIIIHKDSKYYMEKSKYSSILGDFNKELRNLILYKSFDFKMPARLGVLRIRKKKIKPYIDKEGNFVNPLPPDWQATLKLWDDDPIAKEQKKLVRHLNKHSNGYLVLWNYNKYTANYKNKSAYDFLFCRTAHTMLGNVVKDVDNKIDYYVL